MKIKNKIYYGGGGSSGGTQNVDQKTTTLPWATAMPYIDAGYNQAARVYAEGPQKYTPFSQVANLTADQNAQIEGTNQYVNSAATQNFLNKGANVVQNLMSGNANPYTNVNNRVAPTLGGYLNNNTANDPSQGINNFLNRNLQDPTLQNSIVAGANQADSRVQDLTNLVQNRFGFSKNMVDNINTMSKQNAINERLSSAFDDQNTQRLQAAGMADGYGQAKQQSIADMIMTGGQFGNDQKNLGLSNYSNMIQMPLVLQQALNSAGGLRQANAQSNLNDATARWNFNQQSGLDNLARYMSLINPEKSWGTSQTTGQTSSPGGASGGGGMGALGGAASGAMAGAALGPWGMAAGAVIGGAMGAMQ